jgi:hypothetical protein
VIRVRGRSDHAPKPQAGRVTDSDGGGRVRVGDEDWRTGVGGRCYQAPKLLGAGDGKTKGNIHITYDSNIDNKRCRRMH